MSVVTHQQNSLKPPVFKSATNRRIVYSISFECMAIIASTIIMFVVSGNIGNSFVASVVATTTALIYGFIYNTGFEWFEKKISVLHRPVWMRVIHTLGFQVGMMAVMTPVMMVLLGLGVVAAFMTQIGLSIFFVFFNAVFTYCFDKIFGLPPR